MSKLNVDFPASINKFESLMKKHFLIKTLFYKKMFSGKGAEFESYRLYLPFIDDASLIDWKASARAGNKLLIRQYITESSLNVFFITDVGENMIFGSGNKLKIEAAAEVAASLGHFVSISGDSVGFALYGDKIVRMAMPIPGRKAFGNLANTLIDSNVYGGRSDLKKTLKYLLPNLKGTSIVFIISDFLNVDSECERMLKAFMTKYEVVGIMIRDRVEITMPKMSKEVIIEDIYTGEQKLIDPSLIKAEYEKKAFEQKKKVQDLFKTSGSDLVELYTDRDVIMDLASFLKSRVSRRK